MPSPRRPGIIPPTPPAARAMPKTGSSSPGPSGAGGTAGQNTNPVVRLATEDCRHGRSAPPGGPDFGLPG